MQTQQKQFIWSLKGFLYVEAALRQKIITVDAKYITALYD